MTPAQCVLALWMLVTGSINTLSTKFADIPSLAEALDKDDDTKTVEGYPAPWRYYVRCVRG